MWYISYLLFASIQPESDGEYVCETCNVLLEAKNLKEAYQAAELWAKEHETKNMRFIGVEELNYVQDDRPGHGDEIAGSYFDEQDIWSKVVEMIPDKDKLQANRLEASDADKPVEELIDSQMKKRLKRAFI